MSIIIYDKSDQLRTMVASYCIGPLKPNVASENPWMGDWMLKKDLDEGFNLFINSSLIEILLPFLSTVLAVDILCKIPNQVWFGGK